MQLSQRTAGPSAAARTSAGKPKSRMAPCNAATTAWKSWDSYMDRRSNVVKPGAEEQKNFNAIGEAIKNVAGSYKPHFAAMASVQNEPVYKPVKSVVPMSADLHEKLESFGLVYLKQALGLNGNTTLEAVGTSFTTTDINAGICITGAIVQKDTGKEAVVAFVATETERQASWSRLEGLLLHWACAAEAGGAWSMPPSGWKALIPGKSADAGGAMQCAFEKHREGDQQMYVLVLSLPLSGVLRNGGVAFVLKASDAQNTKWLKDETTNKDFFIDIHNLPFAKI